MNRIFSAGLTGLAVLLPTIHVCAQTSRPSTAFVRIDRSPGGEAQALQTAVVRLVPQSGKGELIVVRTPGCERAQPGAPGVLFDCRKGYDVGLARDHTQPGFVRAFH